MKEVSDFTTEKQNFRPSRRGAFYVLAAICLNLALQPCANAVIIKGSGDPAANTTAPTGALAGSGWQYEGIWGSVLGTPIAPQYFIAAQHVGGSIGQTFTFNGVNYTTTAYWNDPNSDLRIWKVDGVFSTYAPLYSGSDEVGKGLVVIGRGTQRGAPVVISQVQTNYTTNTADLRLLGISKRLAQQEFPEATFKGNIMTVISLTVVTNQVQKGWKFGPSDNVMRWGQNKVGAAGNLIVAEFSNTGGTNEAYLSGGDSSGAVFIQESGVWKLAAINYAIEGPFACTATESPFYGAIFDKSGLYADGCFMPNDGIVRPACYYATRISNRLPWIQSVLSGVAP